MPSQEVIDGVWGLGATTVFITVLTLLAVGVYLAVRRWG